MYMYVYINAADEGRPSKHLILDPYGPYLGINMGPIWAAHVGSMWDVQPVFIRGPYGHAIWV